MCWLYRWIVTSLILAASFPLGAVPQVATSIKPVDDLVSAVMNGVGQPVLLIPPGSSPHGYALKPSERQAAEKKDILFWIGPSVETALVKVVRSMRPGSRIITLAQLPEIKLLSARSGGQWGEFHHHAVTRHVHDGPAEFDGHLWLSPANAAVIVRTVASVLSATDAANAPRYAANAKAALERLNTLNTELLGQLAPVQKKPFVVFHDAYQYFEQSFALSAVGSILVSPEAMSSAGRVRDLRGRIVQLGAVCVFSEPQFEPRLVQTLIEKTKARSGTLDPLGANLERGMLGYEQLLRNLANNLAGCLAQ